MKQYDAPPAMQIDPSKGYVATVTTNKGEIDADQAAFTGESLPVTLYAGDKCLMGSTVARGETKGTVELIGAARPPGQRHHVQCRHQCLRERQAVATRPDLAC